MATYLVLGNFTGPAGSEADPIEELIAEGAPDSRKLIEAHGGKLIEIYLTMGQYDLAAIVEFPDDLSCTQAMLAWREHGGSTETLRAYPESEWGTVAAGI